MKINNLNYKNIEKNICRRGFRCCYGQVHVQLKHQTNYVVYAPKQAQHSDLDKQTQLELSGVYGLRKETNIFCTVPLLHFIATVSLFAFIIMMMIMIMTMVMIKDVLVPSPTVHYNSQ